MDEKLNQLIAPRFQTREPARIEILGRKTVLFCRMNNLSTSGAFFEIINSNYTPRRGDVVKVVINLKQVNKTHVLTGEVVWTKGLGLGVVFNKQKNTYVRSKP